VLSAWIGTGYTAMLIASGLRAIPRNTIDAARVDGANAFALLWKIQIPQIHKLLFFLVATLTLQSLATFDLVVALTGGGPSESTDVVSLHLVDAALKTFEVGSASAMSIVFMLFSAIVLAIEYALYRLVVRNIRD
jgi:multiple sugar transport system permease protein